MEALGRADENPNDPLGVDLARIGLGAPPRPPLGGLTPHPSGAGLDGGKGYFLFLIFFVSALFFVFGLADFVCYSRCLRHYNKWVDGCA